MHHLDRLSILTRSLRSQLRTTCYPELQLHIGRFDDLLSDTLTLRPNQPTTADLYKLAFPLLRLHLLALDYQLPELDRKITHLAKVLLLTSTKETRT